MPGTSRIPRKKHGLSMTVMSSFLRWQTGKHLLENSRGAQNGSNEKLGILESFIKTMS